MLQFASMPYGIIMSITGILWLIFIAVWFISAFKAKRNAHFNSSGMVIRLIIIVVLVILFHFLPEGSFDLLRMRALTPNSDPIVAAIGVTLVALGIAFAIWARLYLGSNWGMPMSVKKNPELVTTGPYAYVRHPIYTGMLLAILGSSMTISLWWTVVLIFAGGYFIYSAISEEKLLAQIFPDTYPAYKARTKMLVPFIF
jgi:protein-S-isoprenylcysteine O-methyltransferase Ste14